MNDAVGDLPEPRLLAGLRANTLAALVMLLVEYGLGLAANLYLSLPKEDQGKGLLAAFGAAVAHGPLVVSLHALLGTLLLGAALGVLVRSLRARRGTLAGLAAVAFAAIVTAWLSGAGFVGDGSNGTSLAMGLAAAVAMLVYAVVLVLAR